MCIYVRMYLSLSLSLYIYIYTHTCVHTHIHIHICMYVYVCIYIYIYREREKERCMNVYIYIYMYTVGHAYASELRPAIGLFEPNKFDEASNRIPPTSQLKESGKSRARVYSFFESETQLREVLETTVKLCRAEYVSKQRSLSSTLGSPPTSPLLAAQTLGTCYIYKAVYASIVIIMYNVV